MNLPGICLFILQNCSICLNYNLGLLSIYYLCILYLDRNYHPQPFFHHIIFYYYSTQTSSNSHFHLCNRSFSCISICILKSQNKDYYDNIDSSTRDHASTHRSCFCFLQGRCHLTHICLSCNKTYLLSSLDSLNIFSRDRLYSTMMPFRFLLSIIINYNTISMLI